MTDLQTPTLPLVLTYTISIDEGGNIYNDVVTHERSFAEVYRAFHAVKEEVDRQIAERRVCPFNPKNKGASVADKGSAS